VGLFGGRRFILDDGDHRSGMVVRDPDLRLELVGQRGNDARAPGRPAVALAGSLCPRHRRRQTSPGTGHRNANPRWSCHSGHGDVPRPV
jgi:hypothetical protein